MKPVRRKITLGVLFLCAVSFVFLILTRERLPAGDDAALISASVWSGYKREAKTHVTRRLRELESLRSITGGALFIGDSITKNAPLASMFPGVPVANHGIGWGTSDGVLLRLDQIARNQPDRVFILIGTNDLHYDHTPEHIAGNVVSAAASLRQDMPDTEFYVISILPRQDKAMAAVTATNMLLEERAAAGGYVYLDLTPVLAAADGTLRTDLTTDGLHLNAAGYAAWAKAMGPCVLYGCAALAQ
ncbi:GDSL-type esterase/lipase family protein [Marinicaulis aureus]|uniref:GDSL-type esterase/lipase family protein n=1 Tax=Hyphococcus aureus TaxID=2666033 RepID=A0ABW1KS64_9PROT